MAISSVSKDFVVKHGLVVTTTATFLSTATTDSPYTGALTVAGGVGIGGDLQVAGTIYGNLVGTATVVRSVITQATATNAIYYPVFVASNVDPAYPQAEYTTSSFNVNPSTNVVSIPHVSANYGEFSTATISVPLQTTSPETGALVVAGGVGIGRDLHIGGKLFTDGIVSTGTVVFSGPGEFLPRYTVIIEPGVSTGAQLGFRVAGDPTYGVAITSRTGDGTSQAPLKFSASDYHFYSADVNGNVTQPIEITTSGQVLISSQIDATSTYTGALVVSGGVGIGGDLYVRGGIYANGVPILTTSTIANQFLAGDDILINLTTASGVLTINDVATLQTITNRGNSTNNAIEITNATTSTNLTSGALTVSGGVGVSGNVNAQGIYAYGQGEIGFYDQFSTNYVGFKSSTTVTATVVWTLPAEDGIAGQFLQTDGANKLSWKDVGDLSYPPFPIGDYGLGEAYPTPLSLVDAFGVPLSATFDCMDPPGAMVETDLGVLT